MTTFQGIKTTLESSHWYLERFGHDNRSNEQMTGPELFAYLSERGLVSDWRELTDIPVGGHFAIATTQYNRIA